MSVNQDYLDYLVQQCTGWRNDPAAQEQVWGRLPRRFFYQAAPHLLGSWDGKSSVALWKAEIDVFGSVLPAQKQDRGTCTSRGTSGACNRRQILQISLRGGDKTEYRPVSHAWIYGAGRKRGHDLNYQDGAVGAWMYEAMAQDGWVTDAEAKDDPLSDHLAVEWGAKGPPQELYNLAKEHRCEMAQVTSFQEAADALAAGHLVPVCSDQGFSMTRDGDGFCRAQGSWAHCMHFIGILVASKGAWSSNAGDGGGYSGASLRRGLCCAQSWGENVPDGPRVLDQPSYSFGVDEDVANRMLSQNDSAAIATFNDWPKLTIPWIFA